MDEKVTTQNEESMKVLKPNILYFAPCGLYEGVGGSARLRNMLDVLERLEVNTQLISYLPGEKLGVTHKRVGNYLNTLTVHVPRSSPKIFKLFALLLIFIYGLRYIKKSNIMFAHSPGIVSGFPAFSLAKIFGKPLLIDHMDTKDPDTPKFIYNSVLKNSNTVFTISRYLEEEVKQIGCRNVVYVPVFINTDAFQRDVRERGKIRKELGIGSNEVVIGYSGSFWYVEGVPFLLKAFKSLSDRYGNIKLVLVGGKNAANSDNIPQLINELSLRERVILIPPQPHQLMPKYLSAFDIACSPKIDSEENRAANPIKIYEYMSMGLPTIVSAVGEISNIIENGYDGFLANAGDENDWEKKLEHVIQNLNSLQGVGGKAREKIIKNYTQQVILEKVREALKQLSNKINIGNQRGGLIK